MDSAELDYDLPRELIAQQPVEPRDASRLLVYTRATGELRHRAFRDLPEELPAETLAVVNDTRVVPARIPIARPRGEVLLLEPTGDREWLGDIRRQRRLSGRLAVQPQPPSTLAEVLEQLDSSVPSTGSQPPGRSGKAFPETVVV